MGNAQSSLDNRSTTTASSYPTVKPTANRKRPTGPSAYNFFDGHLEATRPTPPPVRKQSSSTTQSSNKSSKAPSAKTAPSSRTTTSQKSSHVNFFEVAAITPEPLPPPKPISKPPTPASSIQKSYTQSSSLFNNITPTTSRSSNSSCHCALAKSSCLTIDGRAYYKDHVLKSFMLPCDEEEADRLTTLHCILKIMFQWNFVSPVHSMLSSSKQCKVLDIGCGPGTWTSEMATEYPNTDFYGIDQCPIFPTNTKPPNAHFQKHNILKGSLPFEDESFDFIYMRSMMLHLSPAELSNLLYEIHRIMKPGAYFEVVDTNYTIRRAGPLSNSIVNTELKQRINPAGYTSALESNTQHPLFAFLTVASSQQPTISFLSHFVDISHEQIALPLGYWTDQQIDLLHSQNFKKFLTSIHIQDNPLRAQEINTVFEECERYKSYMDWFACYARKPLKENLEQNTLDSIEEFIDGFIDI